MFPVFVYCTKNYWVNFGRRLMNSAQIACTVCYYQAMFDPFLKVNSTVCRKNFFSFNKYMHEFSKKLKCFFVFEPENPACTLLLQPLVHTEIQTLVPWWWHHHHHTSASLRTAVLLPQWHMGLVVFTFTTSCEWMTSLCGMGGSEWELGTLTVSHVILYIWV